MIEHFFERKLGIIPVQIDLVRNLRYSFPIILLLIIQGMIALQNQVVSHIRSGILKHTLLLLIFLIGGYWCSLLLVKDYHKEKDRGYDFLVQELRCILRGDLFCPTQNQENEEAMLLFIKNQTLQSSIFLSMPDDQLANEIRYGAMRPVAFTSIDKNRIIYMDFKKAEEIDHINKQWQTEYSKDPNSFILWAYELSCKSHITHWVLENGFEDIYHSFPQLNLVYENGSFAIVEVVDCK
jgi:hypothetical protein